MSESASVSTNLTSTSFFSSSPQEFYNWFSFNMKLVFFFVVIVVLLSLVFFPASLDYDIMYDNINNIKRYGRRSGCRSGMGGMRCPYCNMNGCYGNCRAIRGGEIRGGEIRGMGEIGEIGGMGIPAIRRAIILNKLIEMPKVEMEIEMEKVPQAKVSEVQVGPRDLKIPEFPEIPVGIAPQVGKEIFIEKFSNEDMMSFSYEKSSEYQSIPLLAPMDESNNPKNLFFGQANRFVISKNGILNYRLELYCNLLVLNGNIYDTTQKVDHMYKVFLINSKNGENILLDTLKKDGDGMYKLKFNSIDINKQAQDFIDYDKIQIVYSLDNKDDILLEGKFK